MTQYFAGRKRLAPRNHICSLSVFAYLLLAASFGATATAATQWPLKVSVDGRFFVQQDGSPYFPIIDTVWMLSYLTPQDLDRYLAHRPQGDSTRSTCR